MAQIPEEFMKYLEKKFRESSDEEKGAIFEATFITKIETEMMNYIYNALKPYNNVVINAIHIGVERTRRSVCIRLNGVMFVLIMIKSKMNEVDGKRVPVAYIEVVKPNGQVGWDISDDKYHIGFRVAHAFYHLLQDYVLIAS